MTKTFLYLTLIFLISSCRNDNRLDKILIMAEDNSKELKAVLEHYKDDPQKLEAARFLILNMPGLYGPDSSTVKAYEPFYEDIHKIRFVNDERVPLKQKDIDSLWTKFNKSNRGIPNTIRADIKTLNANTLINEIDLAFKAWQENVYTRNYSFDVFCEYILPYRRDNGIIIDDARHKFNIRYKHWFAESNDSTLIEKVEQFMCVNNNVEYTYILKDEAPIFDASTLESIAYGLCSHRCWYNSLMLSSVGVAVAIDYIPAWGNRNSSHSWNVVIDNEMTYPFDPFWDWEDFLKYKVLYNNTRERIHDYWGHFIVPKVYRQTYSDNLESLFYKGVPREDIPPSLRNTKSVDVSSEYFQVTGVEIDLTLPKPNNAEYAYLCVFNDGRWQPVQSGKIVGNKAVFKDMGRGIIYLPAYYTTAQVIPAAPPVLVDKNGLINPITSSTDKEDIVVRNLTGHNLPGNPNWENMRIMKNSKIIGITDYGSINNLLLIPDILRVSPEKIPLKGWKAYRKIRLQLDTENVALGGITFYDADGNKIQNIQIDTINHKDFTALSQIIDPYDATCYKGVIKSKQIDFDLGKKYYISAIRITPYFESEVKTDSTYELFYWDNGWHTIGTQSGNNNHLVFENVPRGSLLRLIEKGRKDKERIFLYDDGEIHWY